MLNHGSWWWVVISREWTITWHIGCFVHSFGLCMANSFPAGFAIEFFKNVTVITITLGLYAKKKKMPIKILWSLWYILFIIMTRFWFLANNYWGRCIEKWRGSKIWLVLFFFSYKKKKTRILNFVQAIKQIRKVHQNMIS